MSTKRIALISLTLFCLAAPELLFAKPAQSPLRQAPLRQPPLRDAGAEPANIESALSLQLPAGVVVTTRQRTSCPVCQHGSITNTTEIEQSVGIGLTLFKPRPKSDRSIGEWLYNDTRDLGINLNSDSQAVTQIQPLTPQTLMSVASTRRFQLRAALSTGAPFTFDATTGQWNLVLAPGAVADIEYYDGPAKDAALAGSQLHDYLYWSMWGPFRFIALHLERLIHHLLPTLGVLPLLVLLVLVIRIITFPINRWSAAKQSAFTQLQAEIAPAIADIKSRLKGADQSEAILALYTKRGASPFGGLQGSVGLFVQIPILIAMFNVASESATLQGVSYGWILDVSQPERLIDWGVDIPLLGRFLNPLAVALVAVMLWVELRKPNVSMGAVLFSALLGVALYSFPAFLVIYWLLITLAQYAEGRWLGRRSSGDALQTS